MKGIYRPAQLHALGRFPDMSCSGFLLHSDMHGLLGLPDKQVPHGHIVNPLLCNILLLGLHQTANNIMTGDRGKKHMRAVYSEYVTIIKMYIIYGIDNFVFRNINQSVLCFAESSLTWL